MTPRRLLLGHSPDPDDAFMFYALAQDLVPTHGWKFEHVLEDIQTLNDRALRRELDITAISIHAYPDVAKYYALSNCGASMGDGYGPMVVCREPLSVEELIGKTILVPGEKTTAFLVLNLLLGRQRFTHRVERFDRILHAVQAGQADAGLIIHEGQLTYHRQKLHAVVDLGAWWKEQTDLPLPLGGNVIRRDLGVAEMQQINSILHASIEYGLAHREQAVQHALAYARDMGHELADQFIGMYVNRWTLDYGDLGRRAVRELLHRGHALGLIAPDVEVDFIR